MNCYVKTNNKIIKLVFSAILFMALCVLYLHRASASESSGSGKLTVHTVYEEKNIDGVKVKLYSVENFSDELIVGVDEMSESQRIEALDSYLNSHEVNTVKEATTDSDGLAYFTGLADGKYLIKCDSIKKGKNVYTFLDSYINIPYTDENGENTYEVNIIPKVEMITDIDDPETYYIYKRWDDSGHTNKRPSGITVNIYRDGSLYQTVSLDNSNNWKYSWQTEKGHEWSVAEKTINHYKTVISRSGMSFTITNTYKKSHNGGGGNNDNNSSSGGGGGSSETQGESSDPGTETSSGTAAVREPGDVVDAVSDVLGDMQEGVLGDKLLPQTGQLWWPLPVLIILGIILFAVGIKLNKKD